ncbi:MAG: hypothetical protein KAH54_10275 [Candidatus Sabulitectum sp.]|nr:hypothetical protein [Candidatus Sabulitectum sp.]
MCVSVCPSGAMKQLVTAKNTKKTFWRGLNPSLNFNSSGRIEFLD